MKPIGRAKTRKARRFRRHIRMGKRIRGTTERPRLVVFRSLKHMYAQIVDDTTGRTLVHASDTSRDFSADRSGKIGASFAVGQAIARKAQDKGINKVVFDRAGYPYHGRVKAVAEGAREAGMEF